MPRKLRVEYPGAIYHVMSRGDQREDIFLDDVDRHDLIKPWPRPCPETDWQIDAYCLLRHHYHLVAQAKAGRIVAEELARLQSTENDLAAQQKSDPVKLALAARLRQETTLPVREIAERRHLGKPKGARANLHTFMNQPQSDTPQIQLDVQ
jgi:REP element-mobilizing transposase RayT